MEQDVKRHRPVRGTSDSEPSVREHGVSGYTAEAVGGFGESYASQVAHGAESESPGTPSDSEIDANPDQIVSPSLIESVRRALARAHVDAADMRVEARGSEIHLRGSVRHVFEKSELEARARAVPGVTSVISEVSVLRADWEHER